MSQVSGSIIFEFPTERVARLVAASVVEHLDRVDLVGAIAAAVARRIMVDQQVSTEPGGYPLGGRHQGAGDPFYDRESEGGDR